MYSIIRRNFRTDVRDGASGGAHTFGFSAEGGRGGGGGRVGVCVVERAEDAGAMIQFA